ncbi:MAG: XkdW protein [Neobacillus sp.]|nr:XkdW protein [Neobacillus sp.]
MQIATTILHMYPNINLTDFEVYRYPNDTWKITKWNLPVPKPTVQQITSYWDVHKDEILLEQQSPPSELVVLKEENVQLKKRVEETENAILMLMDMSLL